MNKELRPKAPIHHGLFLVTRNRHRRSGANVNALIAGGRGRKHKQIAADGFPLSKKGRRQAKQPGGRGKYG